MRQVLIAGCGPAGMMAAITAAKAGAAVTVLEGQEKPGKKLLMTGSGRCNLSNRDPHLAGSYYSVEEDLSGEEGHPSLLQSLTRQVFQQFSVVDTLNFFHRLGLLTVEKNGGVYPYTNQAGSVLSLLLTRMRSLGVKCKFSEKVLACEPKGDGWMVHTQTWSYPCDHFILCCGSQAVPSTGSDGSGYALAQYAGHTLTPVLPGQTALFARGAFLSSCAGVRCHAKVTLFASAPESEEVPAARENAGREEARKHKRTGAWQVIAEDTGELQWTEYGISGIVVFQVSRFAAEILYCGGRAKVQLDFVPEMGEQELYRYLSELAALDPHSPAAEVFSGILPRKLLEMIFGQLRLRTGVIAGEFSEVVCSNFVHAVKGFDLPILGTKEFDQCQVCAGGVRLAEVDPKTLRSKLVPHLSFAGEILDVDGPCGGYNLQWAWSSGYVAGLHAAKEEP